MTVSTSPTPLSYNGNGSTTDFPITWKYNAKSHVVATLRSSTGTETVLVLATNYTLTDPGNSGTLTALVAPAVGETLVITLEPPNTQSSALPLGGDFPSTTVEGALDLDVQRAAKIEALFNRALRVPKTDTQTGSLLELPIDTARASKFLAFDSNGKPIVASGTSANLGPVSSFVNTLLDDITGSAFLNTILANLAAESSPATNDKIFLVDVSAGTVDFITLADLFTGGYNFTGNNAFSGTNTHSGSETFSSDLIASGTLSGVIIPPQGRLTLQTGVPVMVTTQSGKTTIFYTPYTGLYVPLYNGTRMVNTSIGAELSQATTDATKSPAAVTTNSNYDMFVWTDSGTIRCTRGPAWTSDTARGTGAGTTELVMVNGVLLNANAITNGPAAQRGTYVGTVRSNGSSQIDWIYGALAAGGTAAVLGVWNKYNRVNVNTFVQESANSWNYTTATWRSANASATMRASYVYGLSEDSIMATYTTLGSNTTNGTGEVNTSCGIGYDSTSALASGCVAGHNRLATMMMGDGTTSVACIRQATAIFVKEADIGFHFCQAIEISDATGTTTWYGDNNIPTRVQTGLTFSGRF